jgi:hypothetical protein
MTVAEVAEVLDRLRISRFLHGGERAQTHHCDSKRRRPVARLLEDFVLEKPVDVLLERPGPFGPAHPDHESVREAQFESDEDIRGVFEPVKCWPATPRSGDVPKAVADAKVEIPGFERLGRVAVDDPRVFKRLIHFFLGEHWRTQQNGGQQD